MEDKEIKEEVKETNLENVFLLKLIALEQNIVTVLIRLTAIESTLINKGVMDKEEYNFTIKGVTDEVLKSMEKFGSVLDDVKNQKQE